jgi:hypothetical protein
VYFCNQEIESLLLRVKPLASISLKIYCQNAKPLTPNQQNVRLYNYGGVNDFSWQGSEKRASPKQGVADMSAQKKELYFTPKIPTEHNSMPEKGWLLHSYGHQVAVPHYPCK